MRALAADADSAPAPVATGPDALSGRVQVSRVLNVPASAVFRAINDVERRAWAPDARYRVVSVLAPRFIRLAFADGALVSMSVTRQGNSRCTVSADITRLDAGVDERAMRERWQHALDALAAQIDTEWG